MADPHKK